PDRSCRCGVDDRTKTPGATTSGLMVPSWPGPRLLKYQIASSRSVAPVAKVSANPPGGNMLAGAGLGGRVKTGQLKPRTIPFTSLPLPDASPHVTSFAAG